MQKLRQTTKPSKQRKRLFQAPDHIRHKLFGAPLSDSLKTSHGVNTLPVRSGDTVRIVRGDHKGFEGKITRIDSSKYRIYVEGLTREKADGTAIFVPTHPSKVVITGLNLDDNWRKKILERKKKAHEKAEAPVKPEETPVETKQEEIAPKVEAEEKPKKRKPRAGKKRSTRKMAKAQAEKQTPEPTKEEPTTKPRAGRKVRKKTKGGT